MQASMPALNPAQDWGFCCATIRQRETLSLIPGSCRSLNWSTWIHTTNFGGHRSKWTGTITICPGIVLDPSPNFPFPPSALGKIGQNLPFAKSPHQHGEVGAHPCADVSSLTVVWKMLNSTFVTLSWSGGWIALSENYLADFLIFSLCHRAESHCNPHLCWNRYAKTGYSLCCIQRKVWGCYCAMAGKGKFFPADGKRLWSLCVHFIETFCLCMGTQECQWVSRCSLWSRQEMQSNSPLCQKSVIKPGPFLMYGKYLTHILLSLLQTVVELHWAFCLDYRTSDSLEVITCCS